MSETANEAIFVREPRLDIQTGMVARVKIGRDSEQGSESVEAQLLDLSRGGAKLSVPSCIPFEEAVGLTITIDELDFSFDVAAEIAWSRLDDDGTWLLGCSFNPSLPEETVAVLATGGCLERRKTPRYRAALDAMACWELSDERFPVLVRDFSLDGFCILCDAPGQLGQRLLLFVDMPSGTQAAISGKLHWQVEDGDLHLLGCSFLNGHDFNHLWDATSDERFEQELESRPTPKWMLAWFAALVALIIAYPFLVPALTGNQLVVESEPVAAATAGNNTPAGDGKSKPVASSPNGSIATTEPRPVPNTSGANDDPDALRRQEDLARREADLARKILEMTESRTRLERERKAWFDEVASVRREWEDQRRRTRDEQLAIEAIRAERVADKGRPKTTDDAGASIEIASQDHHGDFPSPGNPRSDGSATTGLRRPEPVAVQPVRNEGPHPAHDTITSTADAASAAASGGETVQSGAGPTDVPESGSRRVTGSTTATLSVRGEVPFGAAVRSGEPDPKVATQSYRKGRELLAGHQVAEAIEAFQLAAANDADNPLYYYFLAMSQYQLRDAVAAASSIERAAELERNQPIANWGRIMERHQGDARLWLEKARRTARASG